MGTLGDVALGHGADGAREETSRLSQRASDAESGGAHFDGEENTDS